MVCCWASVGLLTFTSWLAFMYVHCVFPSYHTMACGVVAWNLLPFMAIVPDVLRFFPTILKLAVAPFLFAIRAAVLSKILRACAAFCALTDSESNRQKTIISCFIIILCFDVSVFVFWFVLIYFLSCAIMFSSDVSSCINTSRGFAPCAPPTIPTFSICSIMRPALLYPIENRLCIMLVEPCCVDTIVRAASSKSGSIECMSMPPCATSVSSSDTGSGSSIGSVGPGCDETYLFMSSISGVSTNAH